MKFRPQRYELAEAMSEVVEVNSIEELATHLNTTADKLKLDLTYHCYDDRIGWDTFLVLQLYPDGQWYPVGYTNGKF